MDPNGSVPSLQVSKRHGSPESFGWQRRADLDTAYGVVYERPDGSLYIFPLGRKPELARLHGLRL
jgi:hypothetical protein